MAEKFEAQKFLRDNFHDAAGVVQYLRAKGETEPPSEAAVAKWLQRNSMPGEWLAVLAGHLEAERNGSGQLGAYTKGV